VRYRGGLVFLVCPVNELVSTVESSADLNTERQLRHHGLLFEASHPIHGTFIIEGARFVLSRTSSQVTQAAPTLGSSSRFPTPSSKVRSTCRSARRPATSGPDLSRWPS
jgi:hypothetical protein